MHMFKKKITKGFFWRYKLTEGMEVLHNAVLTVRLRFNRDT